MNLLNYDEMRELTEYASKMRQVSIPQVQHNFGWSYIKAKQGIDKLVELKKLRYKKDNVFEFMKRDVASSCDLADNDIDNKSDKELDEVVSTYLNSKKGDDVPFDILQEQEIIKSYAQTMEKLHNRAHRGKSTSSNLALENTKLPLKYFNLENDIRQLVDVSIKFSSTKRIASFALLESSLHWHWGTKGEHLYNIALIFLRNVTDKEFKTIKCYLTDT